MQTNWVLIGCEMIGEKTGNERVGGIVVEEEENLQLNEWMSSDGFH